MDLQQRLEILQKPPHLVTEQERRAVSIALGTKRHPFPMMRYSMRNLFEEQEQIDPLDDGDDAENQQTRQAKKLELMIDETPFVVRSNKSPMVFPTHMSATEAMGHIMRRPPTPSLLPLWDIVAKRLDPNNRNKQITVIGDPGLGKSFFFRQLGKLLHPEGALIVQCGDKNLGDLVCEVVVDVGDNYRQEIDARLANGSLLPESLALLRGLGEEFFVQEEGKEPFIDWHRVKNPSTRDALSEDQAEKILSVLEKVRSHEQLDGRTNTLGMRAEWGPLIKGLFIDKRPVFIDEITKGKEGTEGPLADVLQVINGEEEETTIRRKIRIHGQEQEMTLTIRNSDIPSGAIAMFAGNDASDGAATYKMSESIADRLRPLLLPKPSLEDRKHFVSARLMGLPATMHYLLSARYAEENQDGFASYLHGLRKHGLSEAAEAAIPPHEEVFIENWPRILQMVKQVAEFYHQADQLWDPESELRAQPAYAECEESEKDEAMTRRPFSMRQMLEHMDEALLRMAETEEMDGSYEPSLDGLGELPDDAELSTYNPAEHFGSNLQSILIDHVGRQTDGRPHLQKHFHKLMQDTGIIKSDEKVLKQGGIKPIDQLGNIDAFSDMGGREELLAMQKIMVSLIRDQYPDIDASDDEIAPLNALGKALQAISETFEQTTSGVNRNFVVPNTDIDHFADQPLGQIETSDVPLIDGDEVDLIDTRTFLAALSLPGVGARNLDALWTRCFSEDLDANPEKLLFESDQDITNPADREKKIAENRKRTDPIRAFAEGESDTGVMLTSVMTVNDDGAKELLHILRDTDQNKTLIVGGSVSAGLSDSLNNAGIFYVDRSQDGAEKKIESFYSQMLGRFDESHRKEMERYLRTAFWLRHDADANEEATSLALPDLMHKGSDLKGPTPHYMTRRAYAPKPR